MPHVREETLNTLLSLLLNEHEGISAASEVRSGREAIDITVRHDGVAEPVPILVEAKLGTTKAKRRAATKQAQSRLETNPRSIAFGLCYPEHLRDGRATTEETIKALSESTIAFAPVRRFAKDSTWRDGSVSDFVDSLRNVDLSRQRVADAIEYTVHEVAQLLFSYDCAADLADALALPKRREDLRAASLVAALMLSNAALLHHRLRLVDSVANVVTLETVLNGADPAEAPSRVRAAWKEILAIDFNPVFAPAHAVLATLADQDAAEPMRWIMENAVAVADEVASLRFDHAGPLYHRLLASAKFDGSYYTNHVSAVLLARLALTEDSADWSDPDGLASLRIIDPACGTGTLLMAAMHAIRDRHEHAAGKQAESDPLHLALVEDVLYGLDINRHGIQLAACNLTLGNPRVDYTRMNLFTMQHGPQPAGGSKAGSLEFLGTAHDESELASLVVPLPSADGLDAERAEVGSAPGDSLSKQFDLVIMNPPYTRLDIRNRQYGTKDRRAIREREKQIAGFFVSQDAEAARAIDQGSVSTFFTPIADLLLKKDAATLAKVAPVTALTNASGIEERKFLANRFEVETVVTSHDPTKINFSENTDIHESLIIARRARHDRQRGPTRFISLARMPLDSHEAILLSDLVNHGDDLGDWGTEHSWPWPRVRDGDWRAAQFYDIDLAEALHDLEALADTRLVPAGNLCFIEPEGRRVRAAFQRRPRRTEPWTAPILWDHRTNVRTTMNAVPDVIAVPKPGEADYAKYLCGKASSLLIVNRLRTNTVRVSACYAPDPLLGSAWVPVRPQQPSPAYEQALCAWWNSTPGILTLLNIRAKALDYARFALDALRSLLVPDPGLVDIAPLVDAFSATRSKQLQPWPRMKDCSVRAALDQAAAQVLRIDGRKITDWRKRIVEEPTVSNKRRRPQSVATRIFD